MFFNKTDVYACFEEYYMPSRWPRKNMKKEDVIPSFVSTMSKGNKSFLADCKYELNVPYGETEKAKIDFFYPMENNENIDGLPVVIFIHGGYWKEGDRSFYSCIAKPYSRQPCIVAVLGYDLSNEDNKVPDIEKQCVKAFEFLQKKFPTSKWIVTGHSAGAYLTCCIASYDHLSKNIHAILPLSGIYNLDDLTMTSTSTALLLSDLKSQNLLLRKLSLADSQKVYMFLGQYESPVFHYQAIKYYQKLFDDLIDVTLEVIPGEDHFSLVENASIGESPIAKLIIKLLKSMVVVK